MLVVTNDPPRLNNKVASKVNVGQYVTLIF